MPNIWQQLVNDPHVHLGKNRDSTGFRIFVEETLPQSLTAMTKQICTVETLMETQYHCVDALAKHSLRKGGALAKIRQSLSQFEDADLFLFMSEMSEREYCRDRSGMTESEYQAMTAGKLFIRDLLDEHPAVILAPILRELKTIH